MAKNKLAAIALIKVSLQFHKPKGFRLIEEGDNLLIKEIKNNNNKEGDK